MAKIKCSEAPAFSDCAPWRFDVLNYPDRWSELLQLRRAAYRPESNAADLGDPRDERAMVIIAESQDQIVGSLRLTPSLTTGPILDHTGYFAEPVRGLPDPSEYLESSRACIIPQHQGSGLFWHLAARMVLLGRDMGKRFLIGGARPELWQHWRRCGFKKMGTSYRQMGVDGAEVHVLILCIEEALAGHSIDPKFARVLLPLAQACDSAYGPVYGSARGSAGARVHHCWA